MPIVIEAIFEDGVLKPTQPLPLKEHDRVRIVVESKVSLAQQTAGMLRWTGDAETLERLACDLEFSLLESP